MAAVHGSLTIVDEARYIDLEHLEVYDEALGRGNGVPEGDYVMFAGRQDAWYVLDLGSIRDGVGDPTVLAHDPNDGLVVGSRQRLRPFLAQYLCDVLDADD